MFRNINPNFAIILSTLLWGTWWFPLRLLNESANNNAIPLTLSFLIAGLFLLCFSLKNIHLLSKRNIMLTLVAATMGAAAMCLYNEGLLKRQCRKNFNFFLSHSCVEYDY
jgi:drug/metabolite transporter (DMT)-like permease